MRISRIATAIVGSLVLLGGANAARAADREIVLESRWLEVELGPRGEDDAAAPVPEQLIRPVGTTRWDLTQLVTGRSWIRTIERDADGGLLVQDRADRAGSSPGAESRLTPIDRTDGALDWLAPHLALHVRSDSPWRPSVVEHVGADGARQRLRIRAERAGSGWIHLPSRPYEVVLQRVHMSRALDDGSAFAPHRIFYRWVDPRHGVVAETEWSDDGSGASELLRAAVVDRVLAGGIGLRLYADRQQPVIGFPVLYGFDRGSGTTIASLDPAAHTTIENMYGASSWDLTGNNLTNYPGMIESAGTVAPINTNETCSANECGFTQAGAVLGREDKNWDLAVDLNGDLMIDDQDRRTTVNAIEREDRATDVTSWLRSVVRNQGTTSGGLGNNETRLCYVSGGRTEVPLSQFLNQDAIGWYKQVGDSWSSGDNDANPLTPPDPFQCELTTFNHVCGNSCGFLCELWAKECGDYSGTQSGEVLGEGPITLPSGHTFNALVERTVAEFCVYGVSSCSGIFEFSRVRQLVYLWQTPVWGTIARLMSGQNEPDFDSFTTLTETDIKFGLFPPVSISVGAIADTTVEISWNPGLDTHRIDGYHVYWDTDSGAVTPYAFDQLVPAGQTTLNVGGLTPGTQYFFTVSAISDFTNPDTAVTTTYESILFPQPTDVTPGPVPGEVSATTTAPSCTPTTAIDGLTVGKLGADCELCWTPSLDPCVAGYRVLGATSPEPAANFSVVVADTGPSTCATVNASDSYYLVIGLGSGGTGPWGHFGQ